MSQGPDGGVVERDVATVLAGLSLEQRRLADLPRPGMEQDGKLLRGGRTSVTERAWVIHGIVQFAVLMQSGRTARHRQGRRRGSAIESDTVLNRAGGLRKPCYSNNAAPTCSAVLPCPEQGVVADGASSDEVGAAVDRARTAEQE